jgi:hypothetical protein
MNLTVVCMEISGSDNKMLVFTASTQDCHSITLANLFCLWFDSFVSFVQSGSEQNINAKEILRHPLFLFCVLFTSHSAIFFTDLRVPKKRG